MLGRQILDSGSNCKAYADVRHPSLVACNQSLSEARQDFVQALRVLSKLPQSEDFAKFSAANAALRLTTIEQWKAK